MKKFLSIENDAFGINISDSSLKIAHIKNRNRGLILSSINEIELENGIVEDGIIIKEEKLAELIKLSCETAVGKKITTKYVIASLPEEKSFLQIIQMPNMAPDELKVAIELEVENYIPLPINDVYLDYEVLPTIKKYINHKEILISASPKKLVDTYVSCFKKAGLIPLALELESSAIARAIIKKGNKLPTLIIDFGELETNFIFFSGYSVRFTSSIPIGSQLLTSTISKYLNISYEEAEDLKLKYDLRDNSGARAKQIFTIIEPIINDLSQQISKYLNFYQEHSSFEYLLENSNIHDALLCGGGSELTGLSEVLKTKTNIPFRVADPFINLSHIKVTEKVKKSLLSLTPAIGLAMRKINI